MKNALIYTTYRNWKGIPFKGEHISLPIILFILFALVFFFGLESILGFSGFFKIADIPAQLLITIMVVGAVNFLISSLIDSIIRLVILKGMKLIKNRKSG